MSFFLAQKARLRERYQPAFIGEKPYTTVLSIAVAAIYPLKMVWEGDSRTETPPRHFCADGVPRPSNQVEAGVYLTTLRVHVFCLKLFLEIDLQHRPTSLRYV